MQTIISISTAVGNDLRTRSFFRRDIEKILNEHHSSIVLDFNNVLFISRSVADEIYNILIDHPTVIVKGMTSDVLAMYNIVLRSRNSPREYPTLNAKVYHLTTSEEMKEFFDTF